MKKCIVILTMFIASSLILSAYASSSPDTLTSGEDIGTESSSPTENNSMPPDTDETVNRFPASLTPIPDSYLSEARQQGVLQDLYYTILTNPFPTRRRAKNSGSTLLFIYRMAMTKLRNIPCSILCTAVGVTNMSILAAPMSRKE